MRISGETIDNQPTTDWKEVYAACAKHKRFIVEVRKYSEAAETSRQQVRYWHAIVIPAFAEYTGYSLWKAEQLLKREAGEQWFVKELSFQEGRRGRVLFECEKVNCKSLFVLPKNSSGTYICPNCGNPKIRIFFMLSKMELSVKDFTAMLENTWTYLQELNVHCPKPDKDWKINKDAGKDTPE